MKRYVMLALVLVLVCSLFAGCRRTDAMPSNPTNEATSHVPTILPTTPATKPATEPATQHATVMPTEGNREPDSTTATDSTENTQSRHRQDTMR